MTRQEFLSEMSEINGSARTRLALKYYASLGAQRYVIYVDGREVASKSLLWQAKTEAVKHLADGQECKIVDNEKVERRFVRRGNQLKEVRCASAKKKTVESSAGLVE